MVKPLSFKGDKKPKKRKRADAEATEETPGTALEAAKAEEDTAEDDTWVSADAVSDVAGPIMFVLPSDTPTSLACAASGKVFAAPIEYIVDGSPSSAEPHEFRQVWVANKIAGTDNFRFKGHHGKRVCVFFFLSSFHLITWNV